MPILLVWYRRARGPRGHVATFGVASRYLRWVSEGQPRMVASVPDGPVLGRFPLGSRRDEGDRLGPGADGPRRTHLDRLPPPSSASSASGSTWGCCATSTGSSAD